MSGHTKKRLRGFPCEIFFPQHPIESLYRAAVTQQCSHHHSHRRCYPTVPTPLRHQLHNEHHHCEFTASWDGRRCPHSRVTTVQELGAAPSPHRVPARLLGTSRKFALHTRAAAFQHDVGTQPGACCNTTGIPKESSPILQPELDKRGPFPSENARGRDREDSSSHPLLVSQAGERQRGQKLAKKQPVVTARHSQPASQRNRGSKQLSCSLPCQCPWGKDSKPQKGRLSPTPRSNLKSPSYSSPSPVSLAGEESTASNEQPSWEKALHTLPPRMGLTAMAQSLEE